MPIRASEKARYPADWTSISARVRDEAGQKCEWCSAPNGVMIRRGTTHDCRHVWREASASAYENGRYDDGSEAPDSNEDTCDYRPAIRVVLTVAHLGLPAQLPLFFHVARNAVAGEVVDAVGFLMPIDAEEPEWRFMMHHRAASEFLRRAPTGDTGFVVALPCGSARGAPTRPVVLGPFPPSPIWVVLSTWSLLREPGQTALVAAEPPAADDVEAAYFEGISAALASGASETSLGSAYCFRMTGVRAGSSVIRRLLRRELEHIIADDACAGRRAFPRSCHASLYHIGEYPENCERWNLKALCQRCHLRYDAAHHARNAAQTRRARRADADLFPESKETQNG